MPQCKPAHVNQSLNSCPWNGQDYVNQLWKSEITWRWTNYILTLIVDNLPLAAIDPNTFVIKGGLGSWSYVSNIVEQAQSQNP